MGALFVFALIATTVYANNGISEDLFTGNNGIKAAEAASPYVLSFMFAKTYSSHMLMQNVAYGKRILPP
jgi:hypothetical protein